MFAICTYDGVGFTLAPYVQGETKYSEVVTTSGGQAKELYRGYKLNDNSMTVTDAKISGGEVLNQTLVPYKIFGIN